MAALTLFACRMAAANQYPVELVVHIENAENAVISLTNNGNSAISMLIWGSPFEDYLSQDVLDIRTVAGTERANFTGRQIKRNNPLPEDFLYLGAGQSVTTIVPLVRYYAVPAFTQYSIELGWNFQYRLAESNHSMWLTTQPVLSLLKPQPEVVPAIGANFQSCSSERQGLLQSAVREAEQMAIEALYGLGGLTGDARYNSPRYRQWFGTVTDERFALVVNTFANLTSVLANEALGFSCECEETTYFAFVYKSDPYNITLCPAFWNAPLVGRDSKAGTIIHELTHFPPVLGTADHAYSFNVTKLARDNPDKAVRNADSYEYFAENMPDIDLFNGVVFTEIQPGIEIYGSLSAGQSSFYKVLGATNIELHSYTGNADLNLYETAAIDDAFCTSRITDGNDYCVTPGTLTTYIEVNGTSSDNSSYRLLADSTPLVTVQSGDTATKENKGGIGAACLWLLFLFVGYGLINWRRVAARQ